jgi:SET domain-containing protein
MASETKIIASTEFIEFRPSSIHGLGGFAGCDIAAGTRVIEYVGERITKQESLVRCELNNEYIFGLDEHTDLDGNVSWNPARFLNHSCRPNCDAELREGRIWLVSNQNIHADEELTFNYGFDLVDYREHPCNCGSPDCVGFIVAEELFPLLKKEYNLELMD